jgi:hypothetical protein
VAGNLREKVQDRQMVFSSRNLNAIRNNSAIVLIPM